MFPVHMQKFYLVSNNILFYLLIGLLVFIPLYPKYPLFSIESTFVAIRLEDLLIGGVLLIWFLLNVTNIKKLISLDIVRAFLLFFFIGGLSIFSGIFVTHSVDPHLGLLHWLRRIEYMSLFFLAITAIRSVRQVKILLGVMIVTSLIVILYGFGQIYLNFPVISTTNSEFSKGIILYLTEGARVNSTFAGHYDLAIYLSIILIFIGSLLLYFRNIFSRLALASLGGAGLYLLGQTASRVSFLATLVGLSLVFLLNRKRLLLIALLFGAMTLVVAIPELRHRLVATVTVNLLGGGGAKYAPPENKVTPFTNPKSLPEDQREQLLEQARKEATDPSKVDTTTSVDAVPGEPVNTTELGVYRSFGIRFNVEWPRAINAFLKNPILGTGYSSISLATDNDYLRSLGETGLLGTLSLGLIFALLLKLIIQSLKEAQGFRKCFLISSLCSIVTVLVTALFIDVLEASKAAEFFWILAGVAWVSSTNFET